MSGGRVKVVNVLHGAGVSLVQTLRQGRCPATSSAPRTSDCGRGCIAGRQQVVASAVSAFLDGNSAVLPCGDDAAFLGDDIISWTETAWVSTTPRGRQLVAAKAVKTWPARRRGGRPVSCAACCAHTQGLPVPRRGEARGKHGGKARRRCPQLLPTVTAVVRPRR
jgi:hypothetical protein